MWTWPGLRPRRVESDGMRGVLHGGDVVVILSVVKVADGVRVQKNLACLVSTTESARCQFDDFDCHENVAFLKMVQLQRHSYDPIVITPPR